SLSWLIACSSAAIDFSRPTKSGTTMCGKTMMSRSGRRGRLFALPLRPPVGSLSFLWKNTERLSDQRARAPAICAVPRSGEAGFLLVHDERLLAAHHDVLVHHDLLDAVVARDLVHHIEHRVLEDGSQAACARVPLERLVRDRPERALRELELHAVHLEELTELLDERVLRLRQDVDEGVFRELVQGGHDGETTDELGDQTGADEVLRLNLREDLTDLLLLAARDLGAEAEAALADARLDDLLETDERAAADEEDVG